MNTKAADVSQELIEDRGGKEAPAARETATEPQRSGYSYEALMKAGFTKPQPVVAGLAHQGHTAVFAGAFGQGKTFFALQLSIALATGRDFLGRKVTRPYRTVFVDAENGKGEIKDRVSHLVSALGLSKEELDRLTANWRLVDFEDDGPLHWLNLAKKEGFEQFSTYVAQERPEAILFDCFGKIFPKGEKDEEPMKEFCDGLRKLTLAHKSLQNGLMLFLHHVTKFSAENAAYNLLDNPWEFLARVRGSGRLLDLVQDRLAMEHVSSHGEPYYVVNGILRSGSASPLILQRNEHGFFDRKRQRNHRVDRAAIGSGPPKLRV